MAHVYISAAHKSSGKTTLAIGLCAALTARGLKVQPFKKGPDYIDPLWLTKATGVPCRNLDFFTTPAAELRATFARFARQADIAVAEGNKGLHDGMDLEGSDSNAAMAKLIEAPVVVVADCQGITRGIAPLLCGLQAFDPAVMLAGVILNKVGNARQEAKLRQAVERYTDLAVLGAVRRDAAMEIPERHLGLIPANEAGAADARIAEIGARVADQVDLDALLAVAGRAPLPAAPPPVAPPPVHREVRIAVARDAAFGFYYADDLEEMEAAGAEIVPVDMLAAPGLPDVDGLFIGGGFPETQMAALARNGSLLADVRSAIAGGLPAYAECGGLMYLARSITWNGETAEMAGVLPGDIVVGPRPVGHGHVRLRETSGHPWPRNGADPSVEVVGHEFHYSTFGRLDDRGLVFAYDVVRGVGTDGRRDGIVIGNLVASYAHLRSVGGNAWARRFVSFVKACKGGGTRKRSA